MKLDLNGQSILITGGTGSFGRKFVQKILQSHPNIKKLIVYSRDEQKQFDMAEVYSPAKYPALRYVIGDIRDFDRLNRVCEGVDIIFHAAAMKHVPVAELNPIECIKTNILGSENVINAALNNHVKHVVALSTDKAASPVNLYGATKLCADKLFVAANLAKGDRDIRFSVVRYGNVIGSNGSVMPYFLQKKKEGKIPVTHPDMTRFNISQDAGVDMALFALENAWGGEIFVPKIPSFKIVDLARAIAPEAEIEFIGIRPGERLNEEMITDTDSLNTVELDKYFAICPTHATWTKDDYAKAFGGRVVEYGFRYASETNSEWLTVEDLRVLIRQFIDPDFSINPQFSDTVS